MNEQRGHDEDLVAGDDRAIGRAFRWSLAVIAVTAAVVASVVYLRGGGPGEEPVVEDEFLPPSRAARDVEPPRIPFTDVTAAAGIDFVHENGACGRKLLPETMGPGCAFVDYDGDEDPDILLVNGTPWDGSGGGATLALYRNDGGGTFENVTAETGLAVSLYGMGVATGDYDNDGRVDVFVTSVHENRLFRNAGGRFTDVTSTAGVAGAADAWSTSAAFADFDGDGDLDLWVCNYVRWSPAIDRAVGYKLTGIGRAYGPPTNFAGAHPYYYRNDGDGTFTETAGAAGLHVSNPATGAPVAKALALLPIDFDRDGDLDVFVANDTTRNFLFRNGGAGAFEEIGVTSGVAFDAHGATTGAMGIDAAHFRNDGGLGVAIGNFATEMSSLFVAENERGFFSDEAVTGGIGPASRQMLSFGLFFFDCDNDGRLDLFQTNGHLEQDIHKVQPSQRYRQPSQLFWNCGPGARSCFVPVSSESVGDLALPVVGRAAAYADIDADGDLDVLLTQCGERAVLLRNDQRLGHHWVAFRLEGTRCNRDAIGAWVEVDAGGAVQRRQVMPTRSYLSQIDRTVHVGLGGAATIDGVRVRWPEERDWCDVAVAGVDRVHRIEQR